MKFEIWAEGDRTVGDGTFAATVDIDNTPPGKDEVRAIKETLADAFSKIWDVTPRRVHVMTKEEFYKYTHE